MSTTTTTGTLTAGSSKTFNLAPGSALSLTLSPNVRVTITETPESVSGSGVGGNTTRVHEPQLPGTFAYGPYAMGGGVVVAVASNSGSSVAWTRKDTVVTTDSTGTSLVDGAGNNYELGDVIDEFLRPTARADFLSKAVYYKTNEASGATLTDSLGNGPVLSIGGVTSGIWANPGWITYHSAGNTIQAVGNTYLDSLFSMVGFGGSIIMALDYWYSTIPTTTEALFALWRTQGAGGGFRIARSGGTGVLGAYWTAPGPSTEAGVTFSSDATLLNQRNNLVVELDFSQYATTARVNVYAYRNGLEVRAGDYASATIPPVEAVGGVCIGCNFVSGSFAGKFGSNNGTGQRLGRIFAMRQERRNPLAAQALALWFASGNTELPQSIRSM
jgi:hypothetical protein